MRVTTVLIPVLIWVLMSSACCRHVFVEGSSLSVGELQEDNLVEVEVSGQSRASSSLTKHYYIVKVGRKDKKEAYNVIRKVFEKVVSILIHNKMIPDEGSLVKSKIKPQYQSKKRSWLFSTIFVVLGTQKELDKAFKDLSRIGVQRLQTKPTINFLNQKLQAMELFNTAKARLALALEPLDYEVKEVEQIEIHGKEVENSDIIEEQIEEDFNEESQHLSEKDLAEFVSNSDQGKLEMRVLFRVGHKSEEQSDEDGDYDIDLREDDESESSDDSEDL